MKIHLVAIGHKMPAWVEQACEDYIRRLPTELRINSILLPLIKRGKNPDITRIVRDESRKLLAAVPENSTLVVLDVLGKSLSTPKLAKLLDNWMNNGQDISIIIGGPDGVSKELLDKAQLKISLSELTFPHTLIRVMLVEQLYRAWTINNNHPYHRD